jgi:hypothetical protein
LADTDRLDVDSVRVYRRLVLPKARPDDGIASLLETGKGERLVIEGARGRGRVIVQTFPLGLQWSNLPLCDLFVPLVHEWLWYLAEPSVTGWNVRPGSPFSWSPDVVIADAAVEVGTPLGETIKLPALLNGERTTFRFGETNLAGDYVLRTTSNGVTSQRPFVVERSAAESTVTPLNIDQRQRLAEAGGLEFSDRPLATARLSDAARSPAWNWLFAALLATLLLESAVGALLLRRRNAAMSAPVMR